MALPDSVAAYEDCYQHFDRAVASEKGIRIFVPEGMKNAGILRMRMNYARVLQRREACRLYERDDPRYGKSEYDGFRVKVMEAAEGEEGAWVYVEPWGQTVGEVEEL